MHNSSVNWSYVQTLRAEIVYSSPFLNMIVIINLNLNIPCFPQPQLKMLHTFIPSNEADIKRKPQIYTSRLSGREVWILAHYSIMVVTKRKDLINHCCHPSARVGDSLPLEVPPATKITVCKVDSANISCKILGDRNLDSPWWTWKRMIDVYFSLLWWQYKGRRDYGMKDFEFEWIVSAFWVCYLLTFLMCINQLIVDDDSDYEKGEV